MKLYEIDAKIMECIDDETGEILDSEQLEQLEMERDAKIESVGLWIKNLAAEADAIKTEKNNLAAREKVARNKIDRLKEYLAYALDGEKFKTGRPSVSYRRSESVKVDPDVLDTLADEYVKITREANKTALKDALKRGTQIDGVSIEQKQNMIIK